MCQPKSRNKLLSTAEATTSSRRMNLNLRFRTGRAAFGVMCAGALGLVWGGLAATAQGQQTIISTNVVSGGSEVPVDGTQLALTTNLPGGNWTYGGGANPPNDYITSNQWWDTPNNTICTGFGNYVGACLTLPLASAGAYTEPSAFNLSANMSFSLYNNGWDGGLGFWSTQPVAGTAIWTWSNAANAEVPTNFSGLEVVNDDAIQLYVNGTAVGSSVSLGYTVNRGQLYNLSYSVDTGTFIFDPNGPAASVVSASHAASAVEAVPEPGTLALLMPGWLWDSAFG